MKNKKIKEYKFGIIAIVTAVVIIFIWYCNYILLHNLTETDRGTTGDMFGAVNSLFSGLALAGIILTILLQRQELILQRQELSDTREEFKTQNQTLKLQRFENTFFNLLKLHYDIINDIDFRYYKKKERTIRLGQLNSTEEKEVVDLKGRDVFKFRYIKMMEEMKTKTTSYNIIYLKHYEDAQTDFGHYFRNLYRMIKLVHNADFEIENNSSELYETKYQYISIIRAQLSDYELLWVFYNCLSENGIEKFKPLIEKYTIFKNIPLNLLSEITHAEEYGKSAFNK